MITVRKTTDDDIVARLEALMAKVSSEREQPLRTVISARCFVYPPRCRTRRQRKHWHEAWARLLGHKHLAGAKALAGNQLMEITYSESDDAQY